MDGDEILAIASIDLLQSGRLREKTLVATVMSNFGLDEALGAAGGKVLRTKVGDRYVIEEMVQRDLNLGGEQSGHMIFRDFSTTGDGIVSALQILRIMRATGQTVERIEALPDEISAGATKPAGERKAAAGGDAGGDETRERSGGGTERQRPRPAALFRDGAKDPAC